MRENPILLADLELIDQALQNKQRFNDSTILVTGCAGFLGFYLLNYLVRYAGSLGIQRVLGLDNFLLARPAWLDDLADAYPSVLEIHKFEMGVDELAAVPSAATADFVIHAASIASPPFYRQYPVETVDANVWGLRSLLDLFKGKTHLRGMLFFSSSEIYGDPEPQFIPTAEDYRGSVSCVGPRACYDESKRFGETLCWIYAMHHGMPIVVARPFNNYGPGMRLDDRRLPADFAAGVIAGRDLAMLSDGTPMRTFCYVADAVAGYLLCLLDGRYDTYNIGIDKPEISVRGMAELFRASGREVFGYTGAARFETSPDPDYMTNNPNRRCPVIDKARAQLGYDPKIEVAEGVTRYLRFLDHEMRR